MSDPLVAFLLEQIAEDEALARQAFAGHNDAEAGWAEIWSGAVQLGEHEDLLVTNDSGISRHIARWDPARVLTEVEAKRRLVELHLPGSDPCDAHDASLQSTPCEVIELLALPYADRPGYDPAWGER